jgi:hypothetical protein
MSQSPFDVVERPRQSMPLQSPFDQVEAPPGNWDTTVAAPLRPAPKMNTRGGVWQSPHGNAAMFRPDELVYVPMPSSLKRSFPDDGLGSYRWLREEARNYGVSVSFRNRGGQNWLVLKGPSREAMLLLRQLFEHMDSRGFDTKDARAACRLTSTSMEAEIERAQETVPATATASNSTIGETTPDQNSTAQEHSGHAHADVTIDTDAIMDTGEHATNPQPSMENVAETSNVAVPIAASVAKKKDEPEPATTNTPASSSQVIKAGHRRFLEAAFQTEQEEQKHDAEGTPGPGTPTSSEELSNTPAFSSRFESFLRICYNALQNLDSQLLTHYDNGLPFLLTAADSLLTSISRPVAEEWIQNPGSLADCTANPSHKVCFCISAWPTDHTLLMNTLPINLVLNINEFKWVTFHVVTFGNDTSLQQDLRKHLGWVTLPSEISILQAHSTKNNQGQ